MAAVGPFVSHPFHSSENSTGVQTNGSNSEEEEVDVEELLYAAQMDFIAHRHSDAVNKLTSATKLNSSAACIILANVYFKDIRSSQSKNFAASTSAEKFRRSGMTLHCQEGRLAAELYLKGLQIELGKQVSLRPTPNTGPVENLASSIIASTGSETEEESTEGNFFDLQRVLELTIGLTDCYRFGVLQFSHSGESDEVFSEKFGIQVKEVATSILRHESVQCGPSDSRKFDSFSRCQDPIQEAISHSYHSRSIIISPILVQPTSPTSAHHIPPSLKAQLTINVHLLYILALITFPENREEAENYWRQISEVVQETGGLTGTKEGNEIVQKAYRRLQILSGIIESPVKGGPKPVPQPAKKTSGDAITEFKEEQKAKAAQLEHLSHQNTKAPAARLSISISPTRSFFSNITKPWSQSLVSPTSPSPETSNTSSSEQCSPCKATSVRSVRSQASSTWSRPPKLLSRIKSSTSVSTLPPDFGSTWKNLDKGKGKMTTSSSTSHARSSSLSLFQSINEPTGWSLKRGFDSIRYAAFRTPFKSTAKKMDAISSLTEILHQDELAAGDGLFWGSEEEYEQYLREQGLQPDENEAVSVEEVPVASTSKNPTKKNPQKRSFFDPTTPSTSDSTPMLITTPPTPEGKRKGRSDEYLSSITPISKLSPLNGSKTEMDPLLVELERKSRVGVKTKCSTCGKKGINYPACPRCKQMYCSKPCRVSIDGAGDGIRHVCKT